ncbi:MAG TPA: CusA/CzcA family heavy metal efflux RND transporter [Polyangiales bacterium]|nr:CusA/CzcA family heavy metal efflux RND transporter [Polyangiales bacterium]
MLEKIVVFSVEHRVSVAVASLAVVLVGLLLVTSLPIDAVPDVTNVQVVVLTEADGLSAEEMERFVTFPVEMGLNGLPELEQMRSVTRSGLSAVTIVFKESMDVWFARQMVSERLREIEADIPAGYGKPQLAPVSTGLGEIYQFTLESDRHTPMELRGLLQWELTPRLRAVRGVIEVNAMGGAAKEYQVVLDPARLAAFQLTLGQVLEALERNNANVGGGWVERGGEQLVIRGQGQLRNVEDIEDVVITADRDGTPIQIRQLGQARIGAALAQGVVTRDGKGEAVTGTVMMLIGQNSRDVVHAVKAEVEKIRKDLPEGARIDTVYDRASFIDRTLKTVGSNLLEGALLVGVVILVFLRSWRASLLVTFGIPVAMLIALFGMLQLGVTGSLMSLGAIDFGLLVDGPIIMAEALIATLALKHVTEANRVEVITDTLRQVARPVVFSVLIILLVYVPLLTLEGSEGKMFRPMATTMALALFGSVIFSLFTFPAGAALMLKAGGHEAGWLQKLDAPYERLVNWSLQRWRPRCRPRRCAARSPHRVRPPLAASAPATPAPPRPARSDRRIPSVGMSEARELDLAVENVLARFPEVETSLAMTGRAEVAVDPVGMENTDILVKLKPKEQWKTAHDLDGLGEIMKSSIEREVPATFVSISQPIEDRTNEMISGSRADVAIQLFGPDLLRLTDLGRRLGATLRATPGAGDVRVERALGLPMLQVTADRARLARYGIPTDDVLAAVATTRQGRAVGTVFEGQRRFNLKVLVPPHSMSPESFRKLPIGAADGQLIPLGQLATVTEEDGPAQISREGMQRRLRIDVNIRGRDLLSFVDDAKARVASQVPLPEKYHITFGGQFENFERASKRLGFVLPVALAIIFAMLFVTFGNIRYAAAVFSGVPFALIGGVVALKLRGMPFSIPAAVGFIALCGIAVLNGVVMASEIKRRPSEGEDALRNGAVHVLRPMLLTATVASIGFLPMAISSSAGSEVQRPLATAVIGGMVSSTLLGLILLPALLRIFLGHSLKRA